MSAYHGRTTVLSVILSVCVFRNFLNFEHSLGSVQLVPIGWVTLSSASLEQISVSVNTVLTFNVNLMTLKEKFEFSLNLFVV